jgi:glycosyltransferase involved in cell wall biosynthesis
VGYVSDAVLNMLYRTCVGFVLLSEGEGFGLVFLEAMFFGKPCIATDADAAQELVRDGESGFIITPGDVGAAETGMRRFFDDDQLCQKLGYRGQERVRRKFMPEHFHERIRKMLSR